MNTLKTLVLAGIASLAMAASASAQTNVYITGSTAFRSQTHTAILNAMTGEVYSYSGGTLGSANFSLFEGTISGNLVRVKCSWTGSTKGIKDVSQSISIGFLPDVTSPVASSGGTPNVSTSSLVNAIPDGSIADSEQSSTPYTVSPSVSLVPTKLGVQAFVWVANEGSSANLTNMTPNLAQNLYANGVLPLALFTGQAADHTNFVYAFGRDAGSGTRTMAFGESGIGFFSNVVQWFPSPNVTNATPTALIPTPEDLLADIPSTPEGNGGYASGGSLAALMGNTFNIDGNANNCGVCYMGTGDAAVALANGARILSYNGQSLTVTPLDMTPVKEGKYSFWGYVYLMYRGSLGAGVKKTTLDAIGNNIATVTAPVKLSDMQVSRSVDGGLISPTY